MAWDELDTQYNSATIISDTAIGHDRVTHNRGFEDLINIGKGLGTVQIGVGQVGIEENFLQEGILQVRVGEVRSVDVGLPHISPTQISVGQVRSWQVDFPHSGVAQIRPLQIRLAQITGQTGSTQVSPAQISFHEPGICEIGIRQDTALEVSPHQADMTQFGVAQVNVLQVNPSEISLPSSIALQQLLGGHGFNLQNATVSIWTESFLGQTPFNLNLKITDLPSGQLAEASITDYDASGRPNAGTLLIDHDANGVGWFIDTTPTDASEFSQALSDSAFQASAGSAAFGRYDLFTALPHEMGHLAGFIEGYDGFDRHVQTVDGSRLFVGSDFTATLVDDHLDPKVYPTDLFNPILAPSVRKLPSALDVQLLNTIRQVDGKTGWEDGEHQLSAPLTSTGLMGILNGSFNTPSDWSTRGGSTILSGQAVLTEESPFLSNFSQTFVVPEGAKAQQFTLVSTQLKDSELAPPDAFEVALLDTQSKTSLVGTAAGLTQTDSFLNLQHNGQAYYSSQVTLAGANTSGSTVSLTSPRTVQVDLSGVAAGTLATLYFDLLGFGTRDGSVRIDNVMLLSNDLIAPVANPDTATTEQTRPVVIGVLTNDGDADGTLDPTSLQLGAAPTNGTVVINSNGTLSYTPTASFVGTDRFTYVVQDNDSALSNEATVTVEVINPPPTITSLTAATDVKEGVPAAFSATATDLGDDTLSYTWDFGDDSTPVTGQALSHLFGDNGTYTTTLSVADTAGNLTRLNLNSQRCQRLPCSRGGLRPDPG